MNVNVTVLMVHCDGWHSLWWYIGIYRCSPRDSLVAQRANIIVTSHSRYIIKGFIPVKRRIIT
jgi:hypothetical protein